MNNIITRKKTIDENINDIFIVEEDTDWNGIKIFKNSLVTVDDNYIFINEMDTNFNYLLLKIYPEVSEYLSDNKDIVIPHPQECKHHLLFDNELYNGSVRIETGVTSHWNKDHFCISNVPKKEELISFPTFKYKGVEYSSWGYKINIDTKDIEGGFYKKDGKFFEMTGERLEDIEVK